MSLPAGTRFGAHEIVSPLGAGGMGEVYRATDTRLKREVAIKVLPASLAGDPDRLARFQREAEVLASLNHPHIAAIYGLEEKDGERALVMELVDGDDLSQLISRPGTQTPLLSVADALKIAKQIAEAVEAAHELGIIHRDLKPSNVKVRPDGTVKVLDFGLAKLTEPVLNSTASGGLSLSPTITTPAMTGMGIILGTAAYMSPEQARGRVVDKRTDIWAFGAVLYEMLTGRRAFEGEDTSLTLAAVMKSDPDFAALPSDVPASVRTCLARCLQKDPRQRLRDMGDVRLMLDGALDSPAQAPVPAGTMAPVRRPLWRRVLPPLATATVAGALMGVAAWNAKPADPRPITRFEHLLPGEVSFRGGARRTFSVSPDGRRIAYSAIDGLYLHALDEVGDRKLVDAPANIQSSTFSPDGEYVAYHQNGQLKRIAVAGGAPVVITDSPNPLGMSWGPDNALLCALPGGITRFPAQGGTPELLVKVGDNEVFSSPQLLPGGDAILFTVTRTGDGASANVVQSLAAVHSLRSGERTVLVQGATDARYLPSGHLLYTVGDGLFGIGLDLPARQTVGGAVSLVQGIRRGVGTVAITLADFDVSANGTLFYVSGSSVMPGSQLFWLDRRGRPEAVASIAPQEFINPRLSADGRRVLVSAQGDLRVYDLETGRETRVTSDRAVAGYTEWVPGDRAVVYSSTRKGEGGLMNIWLQPLDGSRRATQLTKVEGQMHVDAWSPDGRALAAHRHSSQGTVDLLVIPITDGAAGEPTPFMAGSASEESGVFSPDGRFVAYLDAVSGQNELVIRPFPGPGPETPVSVGGAREPAWARNGELFYRRTSDDMQMVVRVTTSPALSVGPPEELFRGSGVTPASPRATYAVSADGQRFLTSGVRVGSGLGVAASAPRPRISIVLNWVEELTRRIPPGK